MKILVTGGAGFVGTNALIYLSKKYPSAKIISFDIGQPLFPIEGIEYVHGDIRSYSHLEEVARDAEMIFHFAAELGTHETFSNPKTTNAVNINGTVNMLQVSKKYDCKLFVASKPNVWLNPYSISKKAAEEYCLMYNKQYKVKVAILKFFSIYGPYQYIHKYQKAVSHFIYKALKGEHLPIYGDGKQQADFVFAQDAVKAADLMLTKNIYGEVIEFSSGKGTRINDLATTIIRLVNSKSELKHLPMRLGEVANSVIISDNKKASEILGYLPETELEDGIKQTIKFYKQLIESKNSLMF